MQIDLSTFGWSKVLFNSKSTIDINLKTVLSYFSNVALSIDTLDRSNYRRKQYEEFTIKLDGYQQAAGINETTRDLIWTKTMQNGKLLEHHRAS